jgi:7,8-dihydropterin-6-yl-methyl-4-(beta-D-ribofuranosyl)aminobenzene 5'-phosphate synthase
MKLTFRLTGLTLLLVMSTTLATDPGPDITGSADPSVHITIIYDNYMSDPNLKPDWGFGCMVEYQGDRMLFDAGRDASIYIKNMQALGIDPVQFNALFISHHHGDHTAGIPWILEENPSITCYLPAAYESMLRSDHNLPEHYKGYSSPAHITGPFYSTGDHFKAFREQGLVIKTEKGGVLVTGCGHPGIVEMVKAAKEELGIDVSSVIGGLHLMNASDTQLKEIAARLKEMGIQQICPTHCTGDHAIAYLKSSFGEGYMEGGTGKEIILQ